jgi:hypothetical protein
MASGEGACAGAGGTRFSFVAAINPAVERAAGPWGAVRLVLSWSDGAMASSSDAHTSFDREAGLSCKRGRA